MTHDLVIPASIAATVADARLPENYERAKQALAECERIDSCLEWADKAAALASYARQAEDPDLENFARRIRARSYRRCGELLREIAPAKNQYACGGASTSRSQAARDAGLSRDQKITALRIANVPAVEFEEAVESKNPPGTTAFADMGRKVRVDVETTNYQVRAPQFLDDSGLPVEPPGSAILTQLAAASWPHVGRVSTIDP